MSHVNVKLSLVINFIQQFLRVHYNVILKAIDVDGEPLDLPPSIASFGGNGGTIIDSGTTLAYLPQDLYNSLIKQVPKSLFSLPLFLVYNRRAVTCYFLKIIYRLLLGHRWNFTWYRRLLRVSVSPPSKMTCFMFLASS